MISKNKHVILITGGSGLLALNFAVQLRDKASVYLGFHKRIIEIPDVEGFKINLESPDSIRKVFERISPTLVIHTAGLTNVELCESDPLLAEYVNVQLSEIIAKISSEFGVAFVHISTDHLFDGKKSYYTETDVVCPVNAYGKTKADAEIVALAENSKALVIRTNFYGWGPTYRKSFSDFIISSLRKNQMIKLFSDVFYTPILVSELIQAIQDLVELNQKGIFNVVSDKRLSKYEFGLLVAKSFGLPQSLIKEASYESNSLRIIRPLDMSLSNQKLKTVLQRPMGTVFDHLHILSHQETLPLYNLITKL